MSNVITFTPIGEQAYYSKKKLATESTMYVENRFRLSFFITDKIYAYYMGMYYAAPLVLGIELIDLVKAIINQCSDSRKYTPVEDNDLD